MVSYGAWVEGDELGNPRGTIGDICVEPAEVREGTMDRLSVGNSILGLEGESMLHGAKEVA